MSYPKFIYKFVFSALNTLCWYILIECIKLFMKCNVESINLVKNQGKDTERVEFRVDSVEVITNAG